MMIFQLYFSQDFKCNMAFWRFLDVAPFVDVNNMVGSENKINNKKMQLY